VAAKAAAKSAVAVKAADVDKVAIVPDDDEVIGITSNDDDDDDVIEDASELGEDENDVPVVVENDGVDDR